MLLFELLFLALEGYFSKNRPQDVTASYGNYMKKGLSFIHFNARSLSSNFKFISNFLTELNTKFDLITISETWSNTDGR